MKERDAVRSDGDNRLGIVVGFVSHNPEYPQSKAFEGWPIVTWSNGETSRGVNPMNLRLEIPQHNCDENATLDTADGTLWSCGVCQRILQA